MKNLILAIFIFVATSLHLLAQSGQKSPSSYLTDGNLKMDILHIDVGQGDATLILGPKRNNGKRSVVLVDSGESPGRTKDGGKIVSEILSNLGISVIDYYISSHHHSDHYGGVLGGRYGQSFVLGPNNVPGNIGDDDGDGQIDYIGKGRNKTMDLDELGRGDDIKVLNFIDRGPKDGNPPEGMYKSYLEFAENMGNHIEVTTLNDVENMTLDLGNGATIECVASNGWVKGLANKVPNVNTENEMSLAILVHFQDFHYFVGGDINGQKYAGEDAYIEREIGRYIKSQGYNLDAFQVNHHGGLNCTEQTFLELAQPEAAIISCGDKNKHGHPHPQVIEALVNAGVTIYQTERGKQKSNNPMPVSLIPYQNIANGHIYLSTDGVTFNVKY